MADTSGLFGAGQELSNALSQFSAIDLPEIDEAAFDAIPDCSHQLVILGNGFDLQCKLQSRYSDFYKEKKLPKVKDFQSYINMGTPIEKEANAEDELTVWDLILYRTYESNWCDIEAVIADWVTNEAIVSDTNDLDVGRLAEELCRKESQVEIDVSTLSATVLDPSSAIKEYIFSSLSSARNESISKEIFLDYLMNELHVLEKQFNEYLEKELSNANYEEISAEYLKAVLEDGVNLDEEDEEITHSILDFNYTTPSKDKCKLLGDVSVANVHGKLGSEIVFGIDGRNYLDNPLIAPFTKTYRLLLMRRSPLEKLIDIPGDDPNNKGTSIIKFYGHSLGAADYSYFQAIFDALDIYGGSTELIFYYNPEVEDLTRKVDAVANLMNTYGSTLDNPDHGQNLMHKLLLEGRLTVRPLQLSAA